MTTEAECTYTPQVRILTSYDIIVCGAGPSGMIAAAAASKSGAKVAIVERNIFLGGLATGGLVAPISEFKKNGNQIVGGIPWEFLRKLQDASGADLSYPGGNVIFDVELYKLVAQRFLLDYGVSLYLGTEVIGCTCSANRISHIICNENRYGLFGLAGNIVIDCTGDAKIAVLAGAPFQPLPGRTEMQPSTLCFRLGGVDTAGLRDIEFKLENTKYANAKIRMLLTQLKQITDVPNFGGPWFHWGLHDGVVYVNMTRRNNDIMENSFGLLACGLREDVFKLVKLLRLNVKEFSNAYVLDTAVMIGHRESRRIQGVHTLTGEELQHSVHFSDTIACSGHPVDIHIPVDSSQNVEFLSLPGYIPYRSLIMETFPNLLVAGKCISADRRAFASIRVQAPCMATGQAAGTAASLCVSRKLHSVLDVVPKELCTVLQEQGAIL